MIVWGGFNGSIFLNPAVDTSRPRQEELDSDHPPTARWPSNSRQTLWTGSGMIVWGLFNPSYF